MTFEHVNQNNFQTLKADLTALIANVLGTSTAFVNLELKQKIMLNSASGGIIIVNFSKDETNLQPLCFSIDFVSRTNKELLGSKMLKDVILKSVSIGTFTNARGVLYGYF